MDVAIAGDQIWVATGTYLASKESELGNPRTVTFHLVSGVGIYGAFPLGGGDGTFGARDVSNLAYETTLSGNIGLPGDTSDNAYHVVTGSGTNGNTVLDGFIISSGNANGSLSHQAGGGFYNDGGSPLVTSCTFSANLALDGGGMYCNASNSGSPPN